MYFKVNDHMDNAILTITMIITKNKSILTQHFDLHLRQLYSQLIKVMLYHVTLSATSSATSSASS